MRISKPTKKRENNALLFKLARALLALQNKGQKFALPSLERVFYLWYTGAIPFLREGRTREHYFLEFMNACERAKYPLGGTKLATVFEKAKSLPLPAEALKFEIPEMRLLVAFLKQMQVLQGTEPFYITYRDCAALLGHKSHTTVVAWLGALAKLEYIQVTQRGDEKRATRYRYIWKDGENG